MSFFDSIFGGSEQQSSSTSGFGALPKVAQTDYKMAATQARPLLLGPNASSLFTPLPQTASETQAYGMEAPMTQDSVSNLAGMYSNPFQQYLTNQINQNSAAGNSAYKQSLASDGQNGSNREFLNEAYNDQMQNQAIGTSLANNYDTALSTGLNQQQLTIQNLLQQGSNQRSLDLQTKQAPVTALQSLMQLLQGFPQSSTSSGSGTSTPGVAGSLQGIAKVGAAAGAAA